VHGLLAAVAHVAGEHAEAAALAAVHGDRQRLKYEEEERRYGKIMALLRNLLIPKWKVYN
jgi:hypothetical protein